MPISSTTFSTTLLLLLILISAPSVQGQTFWGADTLAIRKSGINTKIVPSADTGTIVRLPSKSGKLALESDVATAGNGVGTIASYVADTILEGADWVTVAQIDVDSGMSGVLEYYFRAGGEDAEKLHFYQINYLNWYQYITVLWPPSYVYGNQLSTANSCLIPNNNKGIRCLTKDGGSLVVPFTFEVSTTAESVLWEDGSGMMGRSGILQATFATNEQSPENLNLQNNYQFARGGLTPTNPPLPRVHDEWHKRYFFAATSSGTVSLRFKNYRGRIRRGASPAANQCCVYDIIDMNTNLHLKQVRLLLH